MNFAFTLTTQETIYKNDVSMANDRIAEIEAIYGDDFPVFVHSDGKGILKNTSQRGMWTARFLKTFLSTSYDYIIKIDPDSQIKRKFNSFPTTDIFGNVFTSSYGIPYIQGGCVGFTKSAAKKIIDSDYLSDKKYSEPLYWLLYTYNLKGRDVKMNTSFQDAIVFDVARRLKLSISPWKDVAVFGQLKTKQYIPGDYAVVHPIGIDNA
jgi:hypothetical protein